MTNHKNEPNIARPFELVGEFVSIFQRHDTWYANYQHEGKQTRRSLKTKSKKEARRRALMIEKEILAGEHKHHKRPPLIKEVVDQYETFLRAEGRSKKTIGKYRYCFQLLLDVAERTRKTRISQVDVALLDAFRADRAAGSKERPPAKPKTMHNDTVTIRQLVNFALKRDLIVDDPLHELKIKKPRRTPQPCWSREQVEQILASARLPHLGPLVFLAETGARVGEAKWLHWEDVEFDRHLIHIRPKDGWKPKSGDERAIPMSNRLQKMLAGMHRDAEWVFTSRVTARHPETGRQISERRLLQYLKRLLRPLGLQGHLHTFRHSFISFAAVQGVPERVLRKWIGHVDREILDWYFHLADRESQGAMERLSDAAAQITSNHLESPGAGGGSQISAVSAHQERTEK